MRRRNIIILVILVILIFAAVFYVRYLLNKPTDEPLDLEVTPTAIAQAATATSPGQSDRTCGASGVMKIMEVGIASPLEAGHPGADAVRLVVVDFDEVRVGILAIPADIWVDTPEDLVDELGDMASLNEIYLTAYQTAPGNPDSVLTQKATEVLAQVIVDEFEFVPGKYININGDAFIDLVDTLDGITITLATELDATAENYGVFPVGAQTLDGEKTLDFVRVLYPDGVGPDYFGRLERQNMVIDALLDAVQSPQNWVVIPDLIKDARKMVVTDLSVNKANQLVCMIEEVGSQAEMLVVSDDMVSVDEQGRMIPDIDAIKDLISELEGD